MAKSKKTEGLFFTMGTKLIVLSQELVDDITLRFSTRRVGFVIDNDRYVIKPDPNGYKITSCGTISAKFVKKLLSGKILGRHYVHYSMEDGGYCTAEQTDEEKVINLSVTPRNDGKFRATIKKNFTIVVNKNIIDTLGSKIAVGYKDNVLYLAKDTEGYSTQGRFRRIQTENLNIENSVADKCIGDYEMVYLKEENIMYGKKVGENMDNLTIDTGLLKKELIVPKYKLHMLKILSNANVSLTSTLKEKLKNYRVLLVKDKSYSPTSPIYNLVVFKSDTKYLFRDRIKPKSLVNTSIFRESYLSESMTENDLGLYDVKRIKAKVKVPDCVAVFRCTKK